VSWLKMAVKGRIFESDPQTAGFSMKTGNSRI
jgi:hypothetical protein